MKSNLFLNAAIGAILLHFLFALANFPLGLTVNLEINIWSFLANYLIALVIGYLIVNSFERGPKLYLSVFLVYFTIGCFNILIEAYIFNVTTRHQTGLEIIRGLMVAAVFAPIYGMLFRMPEQGNRPSFEKKSLFSWIWRITVGNVLYLFLYVLAGFILTTAYPRIMDFYQDKIPPFGLMLKTQFFLRAFLFMAIAILLGRSLKISKQLRAVYIGITFAVLGGIAPLLPPNEFMPEYVRLGHCFEVVISNFIYGYILGNLLNQKRTCQKRTSISEETGNG